MGMSKGLFTISDVLGMRKHMAALVLGGRLYRLERAPVAGDEPDFAEFCGVRRRVVRAEKVGDIFLRVLEDRIEGVKSFRADCLQLLERRRL